MIFSGSCSLLIISVLSTAVRKGKGVSCLHGFRLADSLFGTVYFLWMLYLDRRRPLSIPWVFWYSSAQGQSALNLSFMPGPSNSGQTHLGASRNLSFLLLLARRWKEG